MKDLLKDLKNLIRNNMNNLIKSQEEDKIYFTPGDLVQLR